MLCNVGVLSGGRCTSAEPRGKLEGREEERRERAKEGRQAGGGEKRRHTVRS